MLIGCEQYFNRCQQHVLDGKGEIFLLKALWDMKEYKSIKQLTESQSQSLDVMTINS